MVENDPKLITKGNCIIFICDGQGSIGRQIYSDFNFIGSTTLKVGRSKNINKYTGIFLVSMLESRHNLYNYGYKRTEERLKNEVINIPVTPDNQPDYKFMEDYIKSKEKLLVSKFKKSIINI